MTKIHEYSGREDDGTPYRAEVHVVHAHGAHGQAIQDAYTALALYRTGCLTSCQHPEDAAPVHAEPCLLRVETADALKRRAHLLADKNSDPDDIAEAVAAVNAASRRMGDILADFLGEHG